MGKFDDSIKTDIEFIKFASLHDCIPIDAVMNASKRIIDTATENDIATEVINEVEPMVKEMVEEDGDFREIRLQIVILELLSTLHKYLKQW